MDYEFWNKNIFEYFFNIENANTEILFCVDDDVINQIGKRFHIEEDNCIKDFCKSISEKILINKKGKYSFDLTNIKTNIIENIPEQTAIIAFFVFTATKMGEDEDLTIRAYYKPLEKLLDCGIVNNLNFGNCKIEYLYLFETFSDFLNKQNMGKWGIINFNRLFANERRTKADLVGIPIYQSLISANDKALLTKVFDVARGNNHSKIFPNDIKFNNYSRVFKAMLKKNTCILMQKINELYNSWDGEVYEINRKTGEKCSISLPIIHLYEDDGYGNFKFYQTIKFKNGFEEIKFNDKIFEKWENENFCKPEEVSPGNILLSSDKFYVTEKNLKLKHPKKEFVLFKKDEDKVS